MIIYLTYGLIMYATWYVISRLAALGAWLYSKPQTLTIRHYTVLSLSLVPFVFEIVATVLVIFALGFGLDPHK